VTEIINISEWSEWVSSSTFSEGYSLKADETVQDVIDQFVKRFGYQPDRVFVRGNQVRIERKDDIFKRVA
jgi:hypothetical protein